MSEMNVNQKKKWGVALGILSGLVLMVILAFFFMKLLDSQIKEAANANAIPDMPLEESTTTAQEGAAQEGENGAEVEEIAKTQTPEVPRDPQKPSIDEVRSEADGLTILAGRGEPNATVELLVNGVQSGTAQVGRDGTFVFISTLKDVEKGNILQVVQRVGNIAMAAEDIILAPQPKAIIAEATTQAKDAEVLPKVSQPTILKAREDGVDLIGGANQPEIMENVALDTISYSPLGEVLLGGRAQVEAKSVRVYLDNQPIKTLKVDPQGHWRGDLPNVDTGVYTLRVDELDAQGAVSSRIETPFKREDPQTLASTQQEDRPMADGQKPQVEPVKAVTVQAGATLWAIAQARYGDGTMFVRVFEANKDRIANADLIYPGQVFDIPE